MLVLRCDICSDFVVTRTWRCAVYKTAPGHISAAWCSTEHWFHLLHLLFVFLAPSIMMAKPKQKCTSQILNEAVQAVDARKKMKISVTDDKGKSLPPSVN
jgi:hypothetical protein